MQHLASPAVARPSCQTLGAVNHFASLRLRIARVFCFASAAVLGLVMLCCLLWVVSSSSMAFTECNGHYELFSSNARCRQPPLAGLLALASCVLAVLLAWFGSRLGKRRPAKWRLTLPSSGHPTAGFAACWLPLMSNVGRHEQVRHCRGSVGIHP